MELKTTKDFRTIVLNETPLIDVRAPIEFDKGAFPHSVNLPIMDTNERHIIGKKYKDAGNEEATKLGYELVSGENKTYKVMAWLNFINENPNTLIYCFRGGQRSRISQEWIQESLGREITRIEGGYKAFRQYLLDAFLKENQQYHPIRLGGHTGSGKTILLKQLDNIIDLESIAYHRGSAFGDHATEQPTQINFENRLAYTLIQQQEKGYKNLIFEDEGRNVGKRFMPKSFVDYTRSGDYVILNVPFEKRVQITLEEYVHEAQQEYTNLNSENGLQNWHDYIITSLDKMQKRLGGLRHKEVSDLFETAYKDQLISGSYQKHETWVHWLLKEYYDPMYAYQIENVKDQIVFEGDATAVLDYLKTTNQIK